MLFKVESPLTVKFVLTVVSFNVLAPVTSNVPPTATLPSKFKLCILIVLLVKSKVPLILVSFKVLAPVTFNVPLTVVLFNKLLAVTVILPITFAFPLIYVLFNDVTPDTFNLD